LAITSHLAIDLTIISLHFAGLSSIFTSINVIALLLCSNIYIIGIFGLLTAIPLFIWASYITAIMLILAIPVLAVAITFILCDRYFNTSWYDAFNGGDVIIYQHLFWFFGHPEVYIIILPIFGLLSDKLLVASNARIAMACSMLSILLLGFIV